MKALQCVELGMPDKLQINEVPDPEILPGHVLINNKAGSVNFPDVLMIQGLYQFQPELPFTPGGESSGIVEAVAEDVKNLKVGDIAPDWSLRTEFNKYEFLKNWTVKKLSLIHI